MTLVVLLLQLSLLLPLVSGFLPKKSQDSPKPPPTYNLSSFLDPNADHTSAGMKFDSEGNMASAVSAFRSATKFQPQDPEVWSNLGVALGGVIEAGLLTEQWQTEGTLEEIENCERKASELEDAFEGEYEEEEAEVEEEQKENEDDIWLDISNFEEMVENSPHVWLVEFGSGLCGSCKEFHPTWKSIVKRNPDVRTGHVVIDDAKGMDVALKWGVMDGGIPSVQLFGRKGMPPARYTHALLDHSHWSLDCSYRRLDRSHCLFARIACSHKLAYSISHTMLLVAELTCVSVPCCTVQPYGRSS
jgi:hypothetical protein